jgi:nucleotide-binding universal stress UspA family protein
MAERTATVHVTRAQRNAARALVELAERRGDPVSDSLRVIAAARPEGPVPAVNGAAVAPPPGSRSLRVTRAERDAARVLVELAEGRGEPVADSLRAVADAPTDP